MSANLVDILATVIVLVLALAGCVALGLWLHPDDPLPNIALYVAVLALYRALRNPEARR